VLVLDSSFLIAYHNTRDVHHAEAAEAMERLLAGEWGEALLLEYVFVEVATVLAARRGIESAARVAATLLEARELGFVPCSELFLDTFETFRSQRTGTLSFTDAAIVTVARRYEDSRVATFDRDFRALDGIRVVPS
jgi:predicted nucleic acid-binding protein